MLRWMAWPEMFRRLRKKSNLPGTHLLSNQLWLEKEEKISATDEQNRYQIRFGHSLIKIAIKITHLKDVLCSITIFGLRNCSCVELALSVQLDTWCQTYGCNKTVYNHATTNSNGFKTANRNNNALYLQTWRNHRRRPDSKQLWTYLSRWCEQREGY